MPEWHGAGLRILPQDVHPEAQVEEEGEEGVYQAGVAARQEHHDLDNVCSPVRSTMPPVRCMALAINEIMSSLLVLVVQCKLPLDRWAPTLL